MNKIQHINRGIDVTLEQLYKKSKQKVSDGYPPPEQRFRPDPQEWREMVRSGNIEFPGGPWHVDLPNRRAEKAAGRIDHTISFNAPPTEAQKQRWSRQSTQHTVDGLPIHPLADIAFTHVFEDGRTIGMFTGPGEHWRYGPALIGNVGLRRVVDGRPEYVAIAKEGKNKEGKKTRFWSLPGGHAEAGRGAYDAALDEGWEESGIPRELAMTYSGLLIATTPSLFGPNTAVAWLDERYLMLDGGTSKDLMDFVPEVNDDTERIVATRWMPHAEAKAYATAGTEDRFSGSHLRQIDFFEAKLGITT